MPPAAGLCLKKPAIAFFLAIEYGLHFREVASLTKNRNGVKHDTDSV